MWATQIGWPNWLLPQLELKEKHNKWIHCNLRKHNLKAQAPANSDTCSWIQLIGRTCSCLEAFWVQSFQYDRCYSCPRTLQHAKLCMSAQENRKLGGCFHGETNRILLLLLLSNRDKCAWAWIVCSSKGLSARNNAGLHLKDDVQDPSSELNLLWQKQCKCDSSTNVTTCKAL